MKNMLKLNALMGIAAKMVTLISGFILPRLLLAEYGSTITGLVSTITQYISLIALLDLGIGAVIRAAFYKPLATHNQPVISSIYYRSKSFFNKIGIILLGYVGILCVVLPIMFKQSVSKWTVISLIVILSLRSFTQFLLGITNQFILTADQKSYLKDSAYLLANMANIIVTIILVGMHVSFQMVYLVTAFIYLLPPLYMAYKVRTLYHLNPKDAIKAYELPQRWHGMAQHIAYTIQESTDVVVLSTFSTLENVTVYTLYNIVFNGIKTLVNALLSGLGSYLGNLLHTDREKLEKEFNRLVAMQTGLAIFGLGTTWLLINPFIHLYVQDVTQGGFVQPLFGYLLTLATFFYVLRLPYSTLVFAKGDFQLTQKGAIVEAVLNLSISIMLVWKLGLIGVAIGTTVSMIYSVCYYADYVSKQFKKRYYPLVWTVGLLPYIIVERWIHIDSWFEWIVTGVVSAVFSAIVFGLIMVRMKRPIASKGDRGIK